jgi:hypothetical protein
MKLGKISLTNTTDYLFISTLGTAEYFRSVAVYDKGRERTPALNFLDTSLVGPFATWYGITQFKFLVYKTLSLCAPNPLTFCLSNRFGEWSKSRPSNFMSMEGAFGNH